MNENVTAEDKLKKLKNNRDNILGRNYRSKEIQRVYDNIQFQKTFQNDPVETKDYDKKIFGYENININPYLEQIIWPESIYRTDKLLRLLASAELEFLKRYLKKKRGISMNILFLVFIIFGVAFAIVLILFLLPSFAGG